MNALIYGIRLQFKLDIRSKSLLITCYLVPLLFFAIMGSIFTSLLPDAKETLIQSMTVMGVSMGAFIGVPPSLAEIYGSDIKKMYHANGAPVYFGVCAMFLSAFIHLMIMSLIIFLSAPLIFHAEIPLNLPLYFISLILFLIVSLGIACILGLAIKDQAKLTMCSQLIFLPSIMLSGIMFPADLLPVFLMYSGKIFPAAWGYTILSQKEIGISSFLPLFAILLFVLITNGFLLKKIRTE